ncbi:MAG: TylF/MycF/NovP-related O-methyltransferase [Crinalium sp.]
MIPNTKFSLSPTFDSQIWRIILDIPWRLADARDTIFAAKFTNYYRLVRPYTICSRARLRGLYQATEYVVKHNIEGDVVECGTARGGSAALIGLTLNQFNSAKQLWVFDTFEGLPSPTDADPDYESAKYWTGKCRGELAEVEKMLKDLNISERIHLVKGLFKDTLPVTNVQKIAAIHLDGDWYESTKCCLDYLYDRISPGGVIQIDDYGRWAGARKAVDEFFKNRGISVKLRYIDYSGRQFIKPLSGY